MVCCRARSQCIGSADAFALGDDETAAKQHVAPKRPLPLCGDPGSYRLGRRGPSASPALPRPPRRLALRGRRCCRSFVHPPYASSSRAQNRATLALRDQNGIAIVGGPKRLWATALKVAQTGSLRRRPKCVIIHPLLSTFLEQML